MRNVTHYLRDSLRLTVNAQKSAVDRPRNRKFLGFTVSRDGARLKVADQAIEKLKATIRGSMPFRVELDFTPGGWLALSGAGPGRTGRLAGA